MTDADRSLARARFEALRQHQPSIWNRAEVTRFHEIVTGLEEAFGIDLGLCRIPETEMRPRPVNIQRVPRSGRFAQVKQYSSEVYCDTRLVQEKIETIFKHLQTVAITAGFRDVNPPVLGGQLPKPEFPKHMHHATKPAVVVYSAQQQADLGSDWSEAYIHQEYPKWKYHRTGKSTVVADADAEAVLGEGWQDFSGPYRLPSGADPRRWSETWPFQHDARNRIKAKLAELHANVVESTAANGSEVRLDALRASFDLFAREFLDAGLFSESILTNTIPQLVYDSAAAGAWVTGTAEKHRGCTLKFGNYWVPADVPITLAKLFEPNVWRWRAKFESQIHSTRSGIRPGPPSTQQISSDHEADGEKSQNGDAAAKQAEIARSRQVVIMPILKRKRWKRGKWATEAGVGKNCVYEYLGGSRNPNAESRKALAEVLGLKPEDLPQ